MSRQEADRKRTGSGRRRDSLLRGGVLLRGAAGLDALILAENAGVGGGDAGGSEERRDRWLHPGGLEDARLLCGAWTQVKAPVGQGGWIRGRVCGGFRSDGGGGFVEEAGLSVESQADGASAAQATRRSKASGRMIGRVQTGGCFHHRQLQTTNRPLK